MSIIPQLADSIDKDDLPKYIADDSFCFEQKLDGWRKLAWLRGGDVEVFGRSGQQADLPTSVWSELPKLEEPDGIALDAELIGETLWVFDLPFASGQVKPGDPYRWRRDVLDALAPSLQTDHVRVLPSARTTDDKLAIARLVIEGGGEGLMVKDLRSAYYSGKRHKGLLKAKLTKSVDCVITRFGVGLSSSGSGLPKSNAELALYNDAGELQVVAECIIHPIERNKADIGSVCEVTYLYCVASDKPRLVQPTRLTIRDDKTPKECVMSQLRFTSKEVHGFRS
jgi:ATP-dependent DNA ligase